MQYFQEFFIINKILHYFSGFLFSCVKIKYNIQTLMYIKYCKKITLIKIKQCARAIFRKNQDGWVYLLITSALMLLLLRNLREKRA